ncbi:MAG: hypothetical protein PW734_11045 [Verrucomicrobium sp.]|nr:hypothetical protein [Verrucomicrobium sp.]
MKKPLLWLFIGSLFLTACSPPVPRSEAELHAWAVAWYQKNNGPGRDLAPIQVKAADAFAKTAAATEKKDGRRMDDDQLAGLLSDVAADIALRPPGS